MKNISRTTTEMLGESYLILEIEAQFLDFITSCIYTWSRYNLSQQNYNVVNKAIVHNILKKMMKHQQVQIVSL